MAATLQHIELILKIAQSAFTILAICVGAVWTYFNFFYRRTYASRLDLYVDGKYYEENGFNYLVITYESKNVGLSRYIIDQRISVLHVRAVQFFEHNADDPEVYREDFRHLGTFKIFEDHAWVEAGETIRDHCVVVVRPGEDNLWQAEVSITHEISKLWFQTRKIQIVQKGNAIIKREQPRENQRRIADE